MQPQWSTSTPSRQAARLQVILQDIDAEWEHLTRSIQADQQALNALEVQRRQLHKLLVPTPGAASDTSPALAACLKAKAHMVSELRKTIQLKEQQRQAFEQHFDQARFTVAANHRHPVQGFHSGFGSGLSSVICALARILRKFWKPLHSAGMRNERVCNQAHLKEGR